MRTWIAALPLLSLAACGGGGSGVETVGSTPVGNAGGATVTPTPTDLYSQFTQPTEAKTYAGIGGVQVYEYLTDTRVGAGQQAQTYAGNASTVRNSQISITYDPRDAIFTLTVNDPRAGAATQTRYQDPASRTAFGGAVEPTWGAPNMASLPAGATANTNIQYLQAGDGDPRSPYSSSGVGVITPATNATPANGEPGSSVTSSLLFFEKPGSSTRYVTFAGYLRNKLDVAEVTIGTTTVITNQWHLERGAFAYGAQTSNGAVPTSGSGSYTGQMLATMVYNPTLDGQAGTRLPSYFQWLSGTSTVAVDFATKRVGLSMAGVVLAPQLDRYTLPRTAFLPEGTRFAASGSATVDLANTGGFTGSFSGGNFTFTAPTGATFQDGSTSAAVNVVGSSIDGAFFGPNGQEVGGGFRVVGGVPDQRIDILGAFTARK